jgi:polyphosphate kinase 2 (PPK2 family)
MEQARTASVGTLSREWTRKVCKWSVSSSRRQRSVTTIFLWRAHSHAPARGRVAIFNRSHYEDVLVARVHKLVSEPVLEPRYDFINGWERLLSVENDTTILKFFLYISKDEQLARFKERLDDPAHQWKISASDYTERRYWNDYIKAFEAVLTRCSTDYAPWFVIPSNHKWFRDLAVSQIIVDALQGMKLELPKPTVDIEEILGSIVKKRKLPAGRNSVSTKRRAAL